VSRVLVVGEHQGARGVSKSERARQVKMERQEMQVPRAKMVRQVSIISKESRFSTRRIEGNLLIQVRDPQLRLRKTTTVAGGIRIFRLPCKSGPPI
jgi:hypothetical protein